MIEAAGLTYGYRRGDPVLRDWGASIGDGEAVAIVGASGSGKSTLLYLLGTLIQPWNGSLVIDGVDITRLGDRGRSDIRAASIGFVFQDALLDARRSVLDNIVEGAVYQGADRRTAVRDAAALMARFGVDVEPGRRAADLSGGQAQRVGLCRALLGRPSIVLADEPTGNLDRANGEVVEDALLDAAAAGAVVVIATHDQRLAARCSRSIRL